jgi:hypothetical protein
VHLAVTYLAVVVAVYFPTHLVFVRFYPPAARHG